MSDTMLLDLLDASLTGDLDSLLILSDFLEELGDDRAAEVRKLYSRLSDDHAFAPFAFQYHNVARHLLLPLFPEHPEMIVEPVAGPSGRVDDSRVDRPLSRTRQPRVQITYNTSCTGYPE